MADKKTITVWWRNVLTGIPESREAVKVSGNYVEYLNGGWSWGWHYNSREEAFEAGRKAILDRLKDDQYFAKKMKHLAIAEQ